MRATNPAGRPPRRSRRTGTVAGVMAGTVAGALAALALTGCTTTPPRGDAPATSGPVTAAPTTPPAETADPRTPPQLPGAEKVFLRAGGRTGPHAFPEIPRIPAGSLEVGVICSGSGTLDVRVGTVVRYTVVCADGDPGQHNEAVLGRAHDHVTVSVTARTTGTWGLAVGWTRNAAAQASRT